nr:MBOAT family protein [Lachnospiraceae bacterium]
MQITSLAYLALVLASLIIYYIVPKRIQWIVLLASSICFFLSNGNCLLIIYPIAAALLTYISGLGMSGGKRKKVWMSAGIAGDLGILIALKYINFPINTINGIYDGLISGYGGDPLIHPLSWMVPLGISFYTLSLIEYLRNVYYEAEPAETNFFRLLLFTIFFPCVVSGPINRYSLFRTQIDTQHVLDYDNIAFGAQRILWGFFKVLVISNRLEIPVNAIYEDTSKYSGAYVIFAAICFTLQLYTNFSGSIDVIMGVAQCFDIELEENFNSPFFSRSIQEFWRRWHITLGTWAKNFVFYPLLRTDSFSRITESLTAKYGKKKAKLTVNIAAMFVLWFVVGLWHGGAWKYIIGSGLLHWLFISIEEISEYVKKNRHGRSHGKASEKSGNKKGFCYVLSDVLRMIRTYLLVSGSFIFFAAKDV